MKPNAFFKWLAQNDRSGHKDIIMLEEVDMNVQREAKFTFL
jgi:hypothetical protein